jgi:CheY-like chemotaxis protein
VDVKPVILLIEDRDTDVLLFRQALSSVTFHGDLRVAVNAWEARDYLEGLGTFVDRARFPLPDLIVCDLHMAGSATDFLKWLRDHGEFRHVPVVLWSGHLGVAPLNMLLEAGGSHCFAKKSDFDRLCSDVQAMLSHLS